MYMSLEEFRYSFQSMKSQIWNNDLLERKLALFLESNHERLPLFYEDKLVSHVYENGLYNKAFEFNNQIYLTRAKSYRGNTYEAFITADQCIGYVWLFRNDRSEGKPYPDSLAEILLAEDLSKIPAFYVKKMGDYYYINNGCHRIYAAYLLENPIRVLVSGDCPLSK